MSKYVSACSVNVQGSSRHQTFEERRRAKQFSMYFFLFFHIASSYTSLFFLINMNIRYKGVFSQPEKGLIDDELSGPGFLVEVARDA